MNLPHNKNESGFTLVELAIVMIIIGLLIGGVIKGQDLIKNAQVAAVITEINGTDAAINTFRDSYGGYPGDLRTPAGRLPNCTAVPCSNVGNGNGRIGPNNIYTVSSSTANNGRENLSAWAQMNAAGIISSVDGSATVAFEFGLPATAFGSGGYQITYHPGGVVANSTTAAAGHYLQMTLNVAAASGANNGFVAASQAARIDRKVDNGLPRTGSIREVSPTSSACQTASIYNEATNAATCALLIGMNN